MTTSKSNRFKNKNNIIIRPVMITPIYFLHYKFNKLKLKSQGAQPIYNNNTEFIK